MYKILRTFFIFIFKMNFLFFKMKKYLVDQPIKTRYFKRMDDSVMNIFKSNWYKDLMKSLMIYDKGSSYIDLILFAFLLTISL